MATPLPTSIFLARCLIRKLRPSATGYGLAAPSSSVDASILAFKLDVEDGDWRIGAINAGVRVPCVGSVPVGSRSVAAQCGWQRTREWLRMDGSGNCRLESKSVVSAIHSDDGGFVSHVLSVDDCFFCRIHKSSGDEDGLGVSARSKLIRCAWCVAAAEWTRYDGWFLAAIVSLLALGILYRFRNSAGAQISSPEIPFSSVRPRDFVARV